MGGFAAENSSFRLPTNRNEFERTVAFTADHSARSLLMKEYDFFICHASEDKAEVASPIAKGLTARGYRAWIDAGQLTVGDRLLRNINEGVARSRYGVVILSPAFFEKD